MCDLIEANRTGSGPGVSSLAVVRPVAPPNLEISAHWATSPFHEAEIKAGMKTVVSGYDIMGGQTTLIAFTSTGE